MQWISKTDTEPGPGYAWETAFLLPDPEALPGKAEKVTLLDFKVRLPTTSARLCAMAANAYGVPANFLRVFFDTLGDSTDSNLMKLIEWKGIITVEDLKKGRVVISKDFLGRTKKHGQGCLYFSTESVASSSPNRTDYSLL